MKLKLQLSAGYYLRFDHLAKLISYISRKTDNPKLSNNLLAEKMGMSVKMIDNLLSYSVALGLKKKRKFELDELANIIYKSDPFFLSQKTLWFLHYFLTSNKEYVAWNRLINIVFYKENKVTTEKAMPYFRDLIGQFTEKSIKRNIPKEINSFFNAYTEQNFCRLEYIKKISNHSYNIQNDFKVPDLCILASCYLYRDRYASGATALEIPDLSRDENSPGRVFRISEYQLRLTLERLHAKRYISVESRANLDQIRFLSNKCWVDIIKLFYED